MIDYETFIRIKNYKEQEGLKPGQIAQALGLDKRTVAVWAEEQKYRQRTSTQRKSKLDPFKDHIIRMLERHPYTAEQIYQQIKQSGYDGGTTIVSDYVRKVRPQRIKAFLKLVFAPGECAQVDWGSYGAVPQKIMVDNLKSAVLKRIVGRAPVFNPRYLDFARHYGFAITACNVGKGNEKGIVENGVGYVKKNLLNGLSATDFKVLEPTARHWLETVANVRTHGQTGKRPIDMFPEEKSSMLPLPVEPYDIGAIRQMRASRQFRITIDANHYSVPAQLAGSSLTVKTYPDRICFYHENNLVARHNRSYDRRRDFEHPDHPKPLLEQRKKGKEQKIFMRFLSLSDKAEEYYRQLEQRRMNPLHHIRQIVALSEIHGKENVARAMEDAFAFAAFSCEYIANLLEQRSRNFEEPGALHLTRSSDLLDLTIEEPDMSLYTVKGGEDE